MVWLNNFWTRWARIGNYKKLSCCIKRTKTASHKLAAAASSSALPLSFEVLEHKRKDLVEQCFWLMVTFLRLDRLSEKINYSENIWPSIDEIKRHYSPFQQNSYDVDVNTPSSKDQCTSKYELSFVPVTYLKWFVSKLYTTHFKVNFKISNI